MCGTYSIAAARMHVWRVQHCRRARARVARTSPSLHECMCGDDSTAAVRVHVLVQVLGDGVEELSHGTVCPALGVEELSHGA
eukprot:362336-Chlamydomonas_euryale.AAC.1